MVLLLDQGVVTQVAFDGGRHTHHQRGGGDVLGDNGSSGNDGSAPDGDPIEDNGADADQTAILELGSMDDGPMADGHLRADVDGFTGITMENGAILNVAAGADADRCQIAPGNGRRPQAAPEGSPPPLTLSHAPPRFSASVSVRMSASGGPAQSQNPHAPG